MAVYFLIFPCHWLFETLFVKKTQERKYPLFKYSHLSHMANFFKLGEAEGNKPAKGTVKQKQTKPGFPSSWPPLHTGSEAELFIPWDHWAAQEPSACFTGQTSGSLCGKSSGPLPDRTVRRQHWNCPKVLLFWGFVFFPLCVSNTSILLELNWSSTGCKSALATGYGIISFYLSHIPRMMEHTVLLLP